MVKKENIINKLRVSVLAWFLGLTVLTLSVSISLQQLFFGLSLLVWLISFGIAKAVKIDLHLFPRAGWRPYYWAVVAWVLWRLVHIAVSPYAAAEAYQFREIWLFLMLPLFSGVFGSQFSVSKDKGKALFKGPSLWGIHSLFWVLLLLSLGGAIVGGFNVFQAIQQGLPLFNYRAQALNNNNALTYSGTAALSMVISAGLFFTVLRAQFHRSERKSERVFFYIITISLFFAVLGFLLARSRGGFVAMVLLAFFLSAIVLRKKAIYGWLVILLLILGAWFGSSNLREVFMNAMPKEGSHTNTMEVRIDLWKAGVAMFKDRPILGYGDAAYDIKYHEYKVEEATDVAQTGSHMHNDLLNTLVLYGIVGLGIFIVFFFLPLWEFLRLNGKYRDHVLWPLMVSGLAGIALMLFMGLSQCHFTDEEVQLSFWVCVSIFYVAKDNLVNQN